MTIATVSSPRSKWGQNAAWTYYFDGRFFTDLVMMATSSWVEADAADNGVDQTAPATDANGWPLAVPAARRTRLALLTYGSLFNQPGDYQVDFTGSLAGGGTLHIETWDGGTWHNHFITASGQQFPVLNPIDDQHYRLYMTGPITACPTNIRVWKVSEGNPATVVARQVYKDLYKRHGHLRFMDGIGPHPHGVNNGGAYGGRWGTEWCLRIVNTSVAAGKSPFYLVTAGDNGNGGVGTTWPQIGETVTGGTSGATGVLLSYENPFNGTIAGGEVDEPTGGKYHVLVQPTLGTFIDGEVLTFGTSTLKAVVDTTNGADGTEAKAVRFFDHASVTRPCFFRDRAGGIPEYVALCNEAGVGIWINLPSTCTAAFATGAATYVRDTLYPWLPVYFAVGNEVWNFNLLKRHYTGEAYRNSLVGSPAVDSMIDGALRGYGHHSSLIMDAIAAVFTGATHAPRLTRVLEGWNGNTGYNPLLMDRDLGVGDLVHEHHDALAVAPYIEPGAAATAQQIYDNSLAYINTELAGWLATNKVDADARSLELICYEAGNGMRDPARHALFLAFQTNPLLGDLYDALAVMLKASGVGKVTHYLDIRTYGAEEGYWGLSNTPFDLTGPKPVRWLAEVDSHAPATPVAAEPPCEAITSTSFNLRIPLTTYVRHVYRKVSSAADSTYVKVGIIDIGDETIANTGLSAGINYTLDVIAESDHGLSESLSLTQSTTGGSSAPTPPVISAVALDATAGTTPVLVSKTHGAGDGTITTNVEVSTDGETSWAEIQATNASATYNYAAAPSGVERYYRGKSTSEHGTSAYGNVFGPVLARPAKLDAPTLFQVSPTTNRGELAPPVPAGSSYKVYRRLEGVNPFVDRGLTVTLEGGVLKWSDTGAVLGTTYDYAMTTVDENGDEGEMGTLATITTMSGGGGSGGTPGSAIVFSVKGVGQLLRGLSFKGRR